MESFGYCDIDFETVVSRRKHAIERERDRYSVCARECLYATPRFSFIRAYKSPKVTIMSDSYGKEHAAKYPGGLGHYKLYEIETKRGNKCKAETFFSVILLISCSFCLCAFGTQVSMLPSQQAEIMQYMLYNEGPGDIAAGVAFQNIENLCVAACIMSAVIMQCSAWNWYCANFSSRVQRYRTGVPLSLLCFLASWGLGWYVLGHSISDVYDRCHSHNPTISDVNNPSYNYEGYKYLCKHGNDRIGLGNFFNVIILIMSPLYFLSNWCGKVLKCLKGVQSFADEELSAAKQAKKARRS